NLFRFKTFMKFYPEFFQSIMFKITKTFLNRIWRKPPKNPPPFQFSSRHYPSPAFPVFTHLLILPHFLFKENLNYVIMSGNCPQRQLLMFYIDIGGTFVKKYLLLKPLFCVSMAFFLLFGSFFPALAADFPQ